MLQTPPTPAAPVATPAAEPATAHPPPFFHTSSEDVAASRAFDNLQRVLLGSSAQPPAFPGPVVPPDSMGFALDPNASSLGLTEPMNMKHICHAASRLLFLTIHWAKGLSAACNFLGSVTPNTFSFQFCQELYIRGLWTSCTAI